MSNLSRKEHLDLVQDLIDNIDFNFSMGIDQQILVPTGEKKQRGLFRKRLIDTYSRTKALKLSTEFFLGGDKQLFRIHRNRYFTVMVKPVLLEELSERELEIITPDLYNAGKDFM